MFDIGIWEMAVIGVVGLVVLGPERLPKVARTVGHMVGRVQRYVAQVKHDINREVELSDLDKVKTELEHAARDVKSAVENEARAAEAEMKAVEDQIHRDLNPSANGASAPADEAPALSESTASPVTEPPLNETYGGLTPRSQDR
jgi:sec-independent protein translocase protein TatB